MIMTFILILYTIERATIEYHNNTLETHAQNIWSTQHQLNIVFTQNDFRAPQYHK